MKKTWIFFSLALILIGGSVFALPRPTEAGFNVIIGYDWGDYNGLYSDYGDYGYGQVRCSYSCGYNTGYGFGYGGYGSGYHPVYSWSNPNPRYYTNYGGYQYYNSFYTGNYGSYNYGSPYATGSTINCYGHC